MPRPVRPWFRFYTEAFNDRKLRRLKPEYRWLFAACLGAARQSPEPGVLLVAEGVPMDASDLADWAGMDVRTVKAGMRALEDLGLIVKSAEAASVDNSERSPSDLREISWRSPTFLDRQYESDNVTKRTRKHRATREDGEEGTFQPSSVERSREQGRNGPETETETEEKSRPRKRGHRLPEGWIPAEETRSLIASERPDLDLRKEHQDFCDYWHAKAGKDATKVDWDLTWRRWMRNQKGNGNLKNQAVPAYRPLPLPDESELTW